MLNIRVPFLKRLPRVGDPVWWAARGLKGQVVRTPVEQGVYVFTSGPQVPRKKDGKLVPQFTTAAPLKEAYWHDKWGCWIVGTGPMPKTTRDGQVLFPDPVKLQLDPKDGIIKRV